MEEERKGGWKGGKSHSRVECEVRGKKGKWRQNTKNASTFGLHSAGEGKQAREGRMRQEGGREGGDGDGDGEQGAAASESRAFMRGEKIIGTHLETS